MNYSEIIQALHDRVCISTAAALDFAVLREADDLITGSTRYATIRLTDKRRIAAVEDARVLYAEDITRQLQDPVQPSPSNMLGNRRFPVVWAVAEVLRTNKSPK